MELSSIVAMQVAIVFILIAVGFILKKAKMIDDNGSKQLYRNTVCTYKIISDGISHRFGNKPSFGGIFYGDNSCCDDCDKYADIQKRTYKEL